MIIVSGCPRSGTSLMMDVMRAAFGEERIVGSKFPREARAEGAMRGGAQPLDSAAVMDGAQTPPSVALSSAGDSSLASSGVVARQAAAAYLRRKAGPAASLDGQAETHDMNPNGFWECRFTVRGVFYEFQMADLLARLEAEPKDALSICKIVSQGLIHSDPRYIDRIVYMVRHPRAVAKSQERLKRGFQYRDPESGQVKHLSDGLKIHTPEMFIQVTAMAARFFLRYPTVPVLFVHYERLIAEPLATLAAVQQFLGGGDFATAAAQIDPTLKRSAPEDIAHPMWEDAEYVHDALCRRDWSGMLEYLADERRPANRERRRWPCPRAGQIMTEAQCKLCITNSTVRGNFRKYAEQQKIDWRQEPCVYECGFDLDRADYRTIEASIEQNFWLETAATGGQVQ